MTEDKYNSDDSIDIIIDSIKQLRPDLYQLLEQQFSKVMSGANLPEDEYVSLFREYVIEQAVKEQTGEFEIPK